ncbi:MAG: MlaD family protein [Burkholderiaceae bacterium]|nr:MlaD family protein [Burkholderiaceae bacterium]
MENKAHAWAAGLFVLTMAALLTALAFWLSRDTRVRDVYELSTAEAVTGLSEQAAVRFRGITVGKVVHIGFDPRTQGNVLVRIAIDQDLPLTSATYGTLAYQGVTGLAFVQLDDDGSSSTSLSTRSDQPTRIPLRPGLLSQFADQGSFLLRQVQRITERVDTLLSPDNQQLMVDTLQSVGRSAERVGESVERMQATIDAQLGPQRTSIPALVADTRRTLDTLQSTAAELGTTAQAVTATAQAATHTASQLSAMAQRLSADQGLLPELERSAQALTQTLQAVHTSALPALLEAADDARQAARSTHQTAQDVDRVVNTISDNPQSLLYGHAPGTPGPGEPGFSAPLPRSTP